MKLKKHLLAIGLLLLTTPAISQLLYPESYVIILDSTKHFKGIVAPSIEIKTPKETYIEINNTTNLAFRFKNHAIIAANKFELTKIGNETILSGGFLYLKYKTFYDNPLVLENYGQYQWADARGLQRKYAMGTNLRYKVYKNAKGGAFIGLGPFYEHEEWNHEGVPDERLPQNPQLETRNSWKLNFYVSSQASITQKVKGELALYFQDDYETLFEAPRLGASTGMSYQISEQVAFGVQLRMLYDYDPIVPVDRLWYNVFSGLEVTF